MSKTIFALTIIIILGGVTAWFLYNKSNKTKEPSDITISAPILTITPTATPTPTSENQWKELPGGLKIQDLVVGTGVEAKSGDTISVSYIGTFSNGTKFDSTADHGGQPFQFQLGSGQVIKGWDEGVQGMRVGGKRKLIIPPSLGYGNQNVGNGLIPPNSTLYFEVELLGIVGAAK